MNLKFCLLFYYIFCHIGTSFTENVRSVTYLVTERPKVVYFNKKFLKDAYIISRRYSRNDPIYYIDIIANTLVTLGNNVSIGLYFYEFQSYKYLRTFVELHFKLCDFTEGSFFGDALKKAMIKLNDRCPFPPGQHNYKNLTIPMTSLPSSFPYRQGRLFCNMTVEHNGVSSTLAEAYIDVEIKVARGNKIKPK